MVRKLQVVNELVPVGVNGQMATQIRVVNWQASYAFYLQGFSCAHVDAYKQHLEKKND